LKAANRHTISSKKTIGSKCYHWFANIIYPTPIVMFLKTNTKLKDLTIKKDVLVGGIVRDGEYMLPVGDSTIEIGDKVIIVAPTRKITELKEIIK
jgi:Trk K+ transport system NAD-binding subunit